MQASEIVYLMFTRIELWKVMNEYWQGNGMLYNIPFLALREQLKATYAFD